MSNLNQTDTYIHELVSQVENTCEAGNPEHALPYATEAANAAEQEMLRRNDIEAREAYANVLFELGFAFLRAGHAEGASLFLDDCLKVKERIDTELNTSKSKDAVADVCYQLGLNGDQVNLFRSLRMRKELAEELGTDEARLELAEAYLGVSNLGGTMLYDSDAEMYLYRYLEVLAQIALDYNTIETSQWFREQTYQGVRNTMRDAADKVYANRLAYKYLTLRTDVVLQTGDNAEWSQFLNDASQLMDRKVLSVGSGTPESLIGWCGDTAGKILSGDIPLWAANDFVMKLRAMGKMANLLGVHDAALRLGEARVAITNHIAHERQDSRSVGALKEALLDYRDLCKLYGSDSLYDTIRPLCLMQLDGPADLSMVIVLADACAEGRDEGCVWLNLRLSDLAFSLFKDEGSTNRLRRALDSYAAYLRDSNASQLVMNDETRERILFFLSASDRYASAYDSHQAAGAFTVVTIDTMHILIGSIPERTFAVNVLLPRYLDLRSKYALGATDKATWQKFSSDATMLVKDASRGFEGSITESEPMVSLSRNLFSRLSSVSAPSIGLQACAVLFATFSLFSNAQGSVAKEYYEMQLKLRERVSNEANTKEAAHALKNALLIDSKSENGRANAYEKCIELGTSCVQGAGTLTTAKALGDACLSLAETSQSDAAVVDLIWMNLSLRTRIAAEERSERSEARVREAVDLCEGTLDKLVSCSNKGTETKYVRNEEAHFVQYLDLAYLGLDKRDPQRVSRGFSEKAYPNMQTMALALRDKHVADHVVSHYLTIQTKILLGGARDESAWHQLGHEAISLSMLLAKGDNENRGQGVIEWCRDAHQMIMGGRVPLSGIREVVTAFAQLAGMAKEAHNESVTAEILEMEQDLIKKGTDTVLLESVKNEFIQDMLSTNMNYVGVGEAFGILDAADTEDAKTYWTMARPFLSQDIELGKDMSAECHLFRPVDVKKKKNACILLQHGHATLVKETENCPSAAGRAILSGYLAEVEYELGKLFWSLSMGDISFLRQAREQWVACVDNGAQSFSDDASLKSVSWYVAILSKMLHDLRDFVAIAPRKLQTAAVQVAKRVIRHYQEVAARHKAVGIWANYLDALNCAKQIVEARGNQYFREEAAQIDREIRSAKTTFESLKAGR